MEASTNLISSWDGELALPKLLPILTYTPGPVALWPLGLQHPSRLSASRRLRKSNHCLSGSDVTLLRYLIRRKIEAHGCLSGRNQLLELSG